MFSNSVFDKVDSQERWIGEMEKNFPEEHVVDMDFGAPCCVFRVPRSLSETKPEAYAPQRFGLGPYHHLRPDLHMMQKQKLAAVREFGNPKKLNNVRKVVKALIQWEPVVRACYDQRLDLNAETLAWMEAVDGLFLLQYLKRVLGVTASEISETDRPGMGNLVGDIIMLENQIPTILLKEIGRIYRRCSVEDDGGDDDEIDNAFVDFLVDGAFLAFCQKHSPLKPSSEWKIISDTNQAHLLERMYHLVVNNRGATEILCAAASHNYKLQTDSISDSATGNDFETPCTFEAICRNAAEVDAMLNRVFSSFHQERSAQRGRVGQSTMGDMTLPHLLHHKYRWVNDKIVDKNKGVGRSRPYEHEIRRSRGITGEHHPRILDNVGEMLNLADDGGLPGARTAKRVLLIVGRVWHKISALHKKWSPDGEHPLVEEIEIPTVSEMAEMVGITFTLTPGGIRDLKLDEDEKKFFLPVLKMNPYSEIILRNLVAYETASARPGSTLDLAEYVNLMCGIIDTRKDVEILKKAGILEGELPDKEIVQIFNGITKTTVENKETSNIAKAIGDAKRLYLKVFTVRVKKKLQKCAFSCGKYINVVFTIVVLLLLMTQAFCAVFGCTRWFGTSTNSQSHELLYVDQ